MNSAQWQALNDCYRAELPLHLSPAAQNIYRVSDGMVNPFQGPNFMQIDALESAVYSQNVIVIGNAEPDGYTLAGAVTAFRSLTTFTLHRRGGHYTSIEVEQPHIKAGETPEEIVVLHGNDYRELLIQYAGIAAKKMGVKPLNPERNLTGYCSWYYYYADVTEQNFLENVEACAASQNTGFAPQVVQIDDGYQAHQGDWLALDAQWHHPLADTAQKITQNGMTPGIWLMPFLCSTASATFKAHQSWFVQNEDGTPRVLHGWSPAPDHLWACLDMTQEVVREHIKGIFKAFWDMGFRYFKLDALCFGLMEGIRADRNATPLSSYRLCFKAIREAVPEAFLLACTPTLMGSLGYVDSCRVSPDTSRFWRSWNSNFNAPPSPGTPCIVNALHTTLGAWWMYDRFFRCDPDTLMARSDNAFYTLGEARISVLTGIMTGVAITSDHLGRITPERRDLLERAAKYRLKDARPLNWRANSWPQTFSGTVDGHPAVAIINDSMVDHEYSLKDLGFNSSATEILQPRDFVFDFIRVGAHDAALLVQK